MKDQPPTSPTQAPAGTPLPSADQKEILDPRFKDLGLIEQGGMGQVRRVFDRKLGRVVALKIVNDARPMLPEAMSAAKLQHPGIVTVYEVGRLNDNRGWLAMRLVDGCDLADIFQMTATKPSVWSRRRLVGLLGQVAQAMAYAHSEGIVHRDLTPRNIRVGRFGEVVVLDWGLALPTLAPGDRAGTRGFIPPEQVLGAPVEPGNDVFALGCILQLVLQLTPETAGGEDELEALRVTAMASDIRRRPSADDFAESLSRWLDGVTRRARAVELLEEARLLRAPIAELREQAGVLERRASSLLSFLEPHAPEADKVPGWRLEDDARAKLREARRLEVDMELHLRAALQRADDLREARRMLAQLYARRVVAAEERGDLAVAQENAARLKVFEPAGESEFLAGDGRLTIMTDPPGAEVHLSTWVIRDRRLVLDCERFFGRTPLVRTPIPRGSHQLRLHAPGHEPTLLPVHVGRGASIDRVPPGAHETAILRLPRLGELGAGCLVPAGWFRCGGDPRATEGLTARRVWVDSFVIDRHPVTYEQLLEVLNALAAADLGNRAAQIAPPPTAPAGLGGDGYVGVEVSTCGSYRLDPCQNGAFSRWPANMISWYGAMAIAAYRAEQTGQPWRLPHELEREKAARGVDGRLLPWGNFFEPTWACTVHSRAGPPRRAPVDDFPVDESPYGVRGLAGNVRDWCHNLFRRDGGALTERLVIGPPPSTTSPRVVRGGAWGATPTLCHAAGRFGAQPDGRFFFVGVRLARNYPSTRD